MKTEKRLRYMIVIDDETKYLMDILKTFTNLSPAQIVQKIVPSHIDELWYYLTWLKQLPEGSRLKSIGANLLRCYKKDSLIYDITVLDPTYKPSLES